MFLASIRGNIKKKAFDGWWSEFNYHYDEEISYKKINKGIYSITKVSRDNKRKGACLAPLVIVVDEAQSR